MKKIKVMTVFGTRPEAIKMAPLIKVLEEQSQGFDSVVVVTAQHRQMLDQVLEDFQITPNHDLNIMKDGQTLTDITSRRTALNTFAIGRPKFSRRCIVISTMRWSVGIFSNKSF